MATLSYPTLIQSTGGTAWGYLQQALQTSRSGLGGGSSFFAPCLFCLMERDFRTAPNKKKAILMWELFFQGNYGTPTTNVIRPDPYAAPAWFTLSLLEQNVEAGGGVKQAVVAQTATAVAAIIASYNAATQLSTFTRWRTSGQRKLATLGGHVSGTMFEVYAKHFVSMVERIDTAQLTPMDEQARKLSIFRPKLAELVKTAEFKADRLGLA